jgi:hypothetical protein
LLRGGELLSPRCIIFVILLQFRSKKKSEIFVISQGFVIL